MLCSISTGKSGSKWLDRLRSSKGFPAGNDLDLEQFLNHHNHDISNSTNTKLVDTDIGPKLNSSSAGPCEKTVLDREQTTGTARENGNREWFGVMNNVLAELFNMGDADDFPRINGKKSSRKQPNPKICVLSTAPNVESENDGSRKDGTVSATLATNGDNSCVEIKQTSVPLRLMKEENVDMDVDVGSVDAEEDEETCADLSAFSRTQVTVIDSSDPSWKCEKLLFRRNNTWKVQEKKSKPMNIGIKKRKSTPLEDDSAGGEKKPKRCNSSKDANEEARRMPSDNVHLQNDKMNKGNKASDIVRQVSKKRFPKKSKKCSSSVILIKSVLPSKKNGTNNTKNCLESIDRQ
ncbi:hypothetical protein U1Q18_004917 [Sarracenia purpurea var. burkii]